MVRLGVGAGEGRVGDTGEIGAVELPLVDERVGAGGGDGEVGRLPNRQVGGCGLEGDGRGLPGPDGKIVKIGALGKSGKREEGRQENGEEVNRISNMGYRIWQPLGSGGGQGREGLRSVVPPQSSPGS